MIDWSHIEKQVNEFGKDLVKTLQEQENSYRKKVEREAIREVENVESIKLKHLESLKLDKQNADHITRILKCISIIEGSSKKAKNVPKLAKEAGLDEETVKVLVEVVRYGKLYQKFMDAKPEIADMLFQRKGQATESNPEWMGP